jgi:HPt (histidine-containing phosphotransfer) domain-containing protein
LLEQCDGNEQLMGTVIALFQEHTPRALDNVRDSISRRASGDLSRSTHGLLGSLGIFGAHAARRLAQQLEKQADEEDYEDAARTFAALECRMAEIYAALARFHSGPSLIPTSCSLL